MCAKTFARSKLDASRLGGTIPHEPQESQKGGYVQQDRLTMSPKEAAAYLELSEDTVVRWFSQGTIEGYR